MSCLGNLELKYFAEYYIHPLCGELKTFDLDESDIFDLKRQVFVICSFYVYVCSVNKIISFLLSTLPCLQQHKKEYFIYLKEASNKKHVYINIYIHKVIDFTHLRKPMNLKTALHLSNA